MMHAIVVKHTMNETQNYWEYLKERALRILFIAENKLELMFHKHRWHELRAKEKQMFLETGLRVREFECIICQKRLSKRK